MSFPSQAPISSEVPEWSLPRVLERTLPWGLHLMVVRIGHMPMMQARFFFRQGRLIEDPSRPGTARLTSVLARHGTESYSSVGLASALDQLGLRLSISLGRESSSASIAALIEHREAAMDLVEEVAFRPSFPEMHLKRERSKALDLHRHEVSDPGFIAGAWMGRLLYPDHPYGRPGATVEGLQAATREDITALHQAVFQPAKGLLMVLGDVDPERTLDELSHRFREPMGIAEEVEEVPMAPPARESRVLAIERPESEQVRILIARRLFARSHPDYYPALLMNRVLGSGASSRLFMELRERQSLTYGAYSYLSLSRYGGDHTAVLDCAPDKAPRALESLEFELNRMSQEPIPEEEVESVRRALTGGFPRMALGLGGIASLLSVRWHHSLAEDHWERHLGRIAEVTVEDVERMARKWLRPETRNIVMVGPQEALESALSGYTGVTSIRAESRDWSRELS